MDTLTLLTADELAHMYPNMIHVPPLNERTSLVPGHLVKCALRADGCDSPAVSVWVAIISRRADGTYAGRLDSEPLCVALSLGIPIDVRAEHVIAIYTPPGLLESDKG